jgi:GT2 family glycosyltransferase
MNNILIITVNYKNTVITENFIHSLENLDAIDRVELIVVDSESTQKTKENLQSLLNGSALKTRLIDSVSNTFFWGGVALALKTLDLNFANGPTWIIACNNDILFSQGKLFSKLKELNSTKYHVIAPSILSTKTGENLNPYMVKPINIIGKLYYSIFYFNPITARLIYNIKKMLQQLFYMLFNKPIPKSGRIYAPQGSFIIFSNNYFLRGGYIDNNFKLFGEEISTAEIALKNNLEIHFLPELEVSHVEHSSMGTNYWSYWFYFSKETYKYLKKKYL